MKWHYYVLGQHAHVRVFMNGAFCGNLVFRVDELHAAAGQSVELVPDQPPSTDGKIFASSGQITRRPAPAATCNLPDHMGGCVSAEEQLRDQSGEHMGR